MADGFEILHRYTTMVCGGPLKWSPMGLAFFSPMYIHVPFHILTFSQTVFVLTACGIESTLHYQQ